ncbi:MAG: hypothetical protein V1928_04395 [Parcubacteria group bacterium]
MRKPLLIPIGGPTGVGESSVTKEIIKRLPKTKRLVTTTSRPPRLKEKNGKDYFFISEAEFKKRIKENKFLEHTLFAVRNVYYGSEKKRIDYWLNRGYNVIANIDKIGALKMKATYGNRCATFFIVPEKFSDLKKRILHRQPDISKEELTKRLAHARIELKDKKHYDYVIANKQGKLTETARQALNIIKRKQRLT